MPNKFKFLFLGLILLAGITFYLFNKKNSKSSFADSSRDFSIENTDRIGKVFVTDRSGEGYTLEKRKDKWYVDSTYPADPEFVEVVLSTINRMTVNNLVPKSAIGNIMKDIAALGKKVEIYDEDGDKLKSFYIGGTNQRVSGTYMVLDGYNIPYEMGFPGWNGDIGGRFWPLHLVDVRSKDIFKYKAGQIKEVSIEYPRDKKESFVLKISGLDNYEITPFNETINSATRKISKGAVEQFLANFEDIKATKVVTRNLLGADTLVSNIPFAQYLITDKDGIKKSVDLFPILDNQNRIGLGSEPEDFFAIVDKQNYYHVQNLVVKKIFWGYSYFYK